MVATRLLVVGGIPGKLMRRGEEWTSYGGGVVGLVDIQAGTANRVIELCGSSEEVGGSDKITTVFKAGTISKGRILLCTTVEVLEYDLASWRLIRRMSNPKFNDVHHVAYDNDGRGLVVVSTGLDAVLRLDWSGQIIENWPLAERGRRMLDDSVDYRQVESTKPHECHPNFVRIDGNGMWVTRFCQKDCINVADRSTQSLQIDVGNPHDGILRGGRLFYTTTNGFVVVVDGAGGAVDCIQMASFAADARPLGWCRGVELLGDGVIAVGFSRIRPTKIKENIKWILSQVNVGSQSPRETRIDLISTREAKLIKTFDLEALLGMNAVFSIHAL